jgi:tRNA G37 N-methylase Trm5
MAVGLTFPSILGPFRPREFDPAGCAPLDVRAMHFTVEAQKRITDYLSSGDIAIDATAGNGHDTLFLARIVGPQGKVIAIDIQGDAVERLQRKLQEQGLSDRVELAVGNHAQMKQIVAPKYHGRVACVMFNLGYLPLGDKSITTTRDSTLEAVQGATELLKPGGMMTLLAYVGHTGGREEATAVSEWFESRSGALERSRVQDDSNPNSPILWIVRNRPGDGSREGS